MLDQLAEAEQLDSSFNEALFQEDLEIIEFSLTEFKLFVKKGLKNTKLGTAEFEERSDILDKVDRTIKKVHIALMKSYGETDAK